MVNRPVAEGALATAAVEIIAELERFEPELRAKLISAVRRVADDAEKEFNRRGARSGKAFADAAGKAASNTQAYDRLKAKLDDLDDAATKAGKSQVNASEKAAAAAERAARAQAAAIDKVRLAEVRLAEVRNNNNAKTSQVLSAEQSLKSARDRASALGADAGDQFAQAMEDQLKRSGRGAGERGADEVGRSFTSRIRSVFTRSGDDAGKSFGGGLRRWLTGNGADLGRAGGSVFGSGFLGALKTPIIGPAIVVILLAALAVAMPAVGAIGAGLFVAAFGAGLGALGIVFAAKADGVKAAWKSTLAGMAADLRVLSVPFERTLINFARVARETFAQFKPALADAFRLLGPTLSTFGEQFGQSFAQLAPQIRPLAQAFAEVLSATGPALQEAFARIAVSIGEVSASIAAHPNALPDLIRGLGELFQLISEGLVILNNINGMFEDLTGGFSIVDAAIKAVGFSITTVLAPFALLEKGMEALGLKSKDLNSDVQISADTAKLWTQGLSEAQAKAIGLGAATAGASPAVESLSEKFARQKAVTDALIESMFRLQNLQLGLSGAQINFQSAVDAATASLKANGQNLDINTEKGRANQSALNQVAQSANAQTQALIESNAGLGTAAASANNSRASFIRLATQMGLSKSAAKAMAIELIGIPNVSREARLTANKADLDAKLAAAKAELKDPNLTKERKATLTATIAQLERQVRAAQAALNSVKDKNVTVTVNYRQMLGPVVPRQDVGVRAPGREHGGPVTKGQPYVVGEKRPEVFVPNQSGMILPRVPAALAAAGAFGAGLTAALHGAGGDAVAGLIGGLSAGVPAVGAASAVVAATVIGTVRRRLDMHSPSRVMQQAGKDAIQGLINGIREKLPNLEAVLTALSKAVPSQVSAAITKVNSALTGLGKALTSTQRTRLNQYIADARTGIASLERTGVTVSANLKKANQDLVDLLKQAQAFAGQVVSTILQTGSITQSQDTSFAGIVKTLTTAVTSARQFQSVLTALGKAGLNKTLLQQIAEAGPTTGLAVGQSILAAGKAGITQVNRLQGQLQDAANKAATAAATALFGQGIQVARGIVSGLQRQKAQLDLAMTRLGDVLVARVLRLLKNTKVGAAGTITIPGFSNGGLATRPSFAAEDGRPELVIPLTKPKRRDQLLERYFPDWAGSQAAARGRGGKVREINMPVHVAGLTKEETVQVLRAWLDSTLGPRLGIRTAGGVL